MNDTSRRVMWLSDSPFVPTGFANVTYDIWERLERYNCYDPYIIGWTQRGMNTQYAILEDGRGNEI